MRERTDARRRGDGGGRAGLGPARPLHPLGRHPGGATLNGFLLEGHEIAHFRVGYVALALLGLRLVWGVVGPDEARFAAFPPSIGAAIRHVADMRAGRDAPHRSHNPLGALMIYALWATLALVAATGVAMESAPFPVEVEADGHYEAIPPGPALTDHQDSES